jgi:hypothetical protein
MYRDKHANLFGLCEFALFKSHSCVIYDDGIACSARVPRGDNGGRGKLEIQR